MKYFRYNYNNYPVSDEVFNLISTSKKKNRICFESWEIDKYIIKILESENYLTGKIPYQTLLVAIEGILYKERWLSLLTSEVYGTGLISHKMAVELATRRDYEINWTIIDEKYSKGIITPKHLNSISKIIEKEYKYYYTPQEIITIILSLLTSKDYEESQMSEETINLLLPPEIHFDSVNETIYRITIHGIYYIITSKYIKPKEKENYISLMLNAENKEKLYSLYNQVKEQKPKITMTEFIGEAILYIFPMLSQESDRGYARKKTPTTNPS